METSVLSEGLICYVESKTQTPNRWASFHALPFSILQRETLETILPEIGIIAASTAYLHRILMANCNGNCISPVRCIDVYTHRCVKLRIAVVTCSLSAGPIGPVLPMNNGPLYLPRLPQRRNVARLVSGTHLSRFDSRDEVQALL